MIRHSICALFLLLATMATASPLTEKADSAYTTDRFQEATALYNKAIDTEGTSAAIYYNLGNSYYRQGKLGNAILCYERALRLDPTNQRVKANLEFVNSKLIDKPGERGTFLSNSINAITMCASSNTWAWIAFGFFTLTIIGILLYFFSSHIVVRKLGFFGGIATILFTIATIILSINGRNISRSCDYAIVTAPSTILSTTPRLPKNRTEEAMLLHEGTKVQITDSLRSGSDSTAIVWYAVDVDNNHSAWISSRDVEMI